MNPKSKRRYLTQAVWALLLIAIPMQWGCVRIPYERQLPDAIRSIYVPMAQNETAVMGLEEPLTLQLQEELLRDGRLQARNRGRADMMLQVVVKEWKTYSEGFHNDEFPLNTRVEVLGDAYLFNPEDRLREQPVMSWTDIKYESSYPSDARYSQALLDVDGKRLVLEGFANEVVLTVISEPSDEAAQREKELMEKQTEEKNTPQPPRLGTAAGEESD